MEFIDVLHPDCMREIFGWSTDVSKTMLRLTCKSLIEWLPPFPKSTFGFGLLTRCVAEDSKGLFDFWFDPKTIGKRKIRANPPSKIGRRGRMPPPKREVPRHLWSKLFFEAGKHLQPRTSEWIGKLTGMMYTLCPGVNIWPPVLRGAIASDNLQHYKRLHTGELSSYQRYTHIHYACYYESINIMTELIGEITPVSLRKYSWMCKSPKTIRWILERYKAIGGKPNNDTLYNWCRDRGALDHLEIIIEYGYLPDWKCEFSIIDPESAVSLWRRYPSLRETAMIGRSILRATRPPLDIVQKLDHLLIARSDKFRYLRTIFGIRFVPDTTGPLGRPTKEFDELFRAIQARLQSWYRTNKREKEIRKAVWWFKPEKQHMLAYTSYLSTFNPAILGVLVGKGIIPKRILQKLLPKELPEVATPPPRPRVVVVARPRAVAVPPQPIVAARVGLSEESSDESYSD